VIIHKAITKPDRIDLFIPRDLPNEAPHRKDMCGESRHIKLCGSQMNSEKRSEARISLWATAS
jgi:hypothetical protein